MTYKKSILRHLVAVCCTGITSSTYAALPSNAILNFNDGVKSCVIGGTFPTCTYGVTTTSGSWFSMEADGSGSVSDNERTPISQNAGILIGSTQPATGSHSGAPNTSESPGIDDPWSFFTNTGMHQTTTAVTIDSDDTAGNVTLDFAGWNVTWNGIPSIIMGGDTANFGSDTGIATLTCAVDCADGDTYTLEYAAHVPLGDASGFGGVPYVLHLEGTISIPPALTCTDCGAVDPGPYATIAGSPDGRVSMSDLTAQGIPDDSGYSFAGGLYDFRVTGAGATTTVTISLLSAIPANAVYRKYIGGAWTTFVDDGTNTLESGTKASNDGTCLNATDWTAALTAGDDCLRVTIEDNNVSYDSNAVAGTVDDPFGVGVPIVAQVDTRTSGSSGCTLSNTPVNPAERTDWWLLAGFISWLGLTLYRRKSQL